MIACFILRAPFCVGKALDEDVVDSLRILPEVIDEIIAREERELKRRELAHRGHELSPQIRQNRLPKLATLDGEDLRRYEAASRLTQPAGQNTLPGSA